MGEGGWCGMLTLDRPSMYEATVLKSLIERTLRLRAARGIEGMLPCPPIVEDEMRRKLSVLPLSQLPESYPSYPYHHKSASYKQA